MRNTLTLLAVCCRCGVWFPVWMLLLSIYPDGPMCPAMALLMTCAVCAVLWKRFCERKFLHGKTAFLAAGLPALLLCCGCTYCIHLLGFGFAVSGFLSAVTLFAVTAGAGKPPETLCSPTAYAAFLSCNIIAAGLLHFANLPVPLTLILTVTGIFSGIWLLLRNQFMLLRLVNRRSASDTDVPQDILRSNLKMVFGIALLIAGLMLFRRPLLQMLLWMQNAAHAAVSALFTLLARLIAWLDSNEPDTPPLTEAGGIPQMEEGTFHPLWLILWLPFVAVAVIVWKNFLSDWYYDLREWIGAFIKRMRSSRTPAGSVPVQEKQSDYYDTETDERPPRTAKQEKREWRKRLRAWMRQPDSREKFYAGYLLLTEAPAWADTKLKASDTVREIQQKWAETHTPADALDAVTAAYHADRYAEKDLPADAVARLTDTLRELR